MKVLVLLVVAVVVFGDFVHCQINSIPGAGKTTFYLDRYSDCDGKPREVGRSTVFISGTSTEFQGQPVTSCSITLNTENIREPYRFKLQVLEVRIDDPGVYFYIYDGEFQGKLLRSFSKQDQKPSDLNFIFTSGQLVTFRMTRGELDRNYDIRVVVEPIPSGTVDCNYGSEHNCDEYGYNYRLLGTKEIAGIIAGCFALVFVIVVIVVCCCYRKQRGISQKWKEEKLGHVNTAASVHSLNGKVPNSHGPYSKKPWTSESSKHGFASIRRSPNLPRAKIARSQRTLASDSSMFDSNASLPVKRPLPPPNVNSNPRGTSERSGRRYREKYDRYEDDRSFDRSFSTATKNFSERNYVPPTYREAMRHDSESSVDEHTFVGADDSGQQSVFVERVMMPSAHANKKTSPQVLRAQRARPPPDQDEEYDSIEPKKKSKALLVDKGAGSEEETDESDTENESEEESSEEESEAESEESAKEDKPDAVYSQPNKIKNKAGDAPAAPPAPQPVGFRPPAASQPQQFQGQPYPGYVPQGVHQPQPRYGYPGQPQPYPQGQPQYPQGQSQYPQGQPRYPQGQPQFPQGHLPHVQQPNPSQPNAYHQANFTVPLQQSGTQAGPQYPAQTQPQSSRNRDRKSNRDPKGQVPPSNPPVYSYLVNRGYKPIDGRYSPVSTSTGASNLSGDRNLLNEDSDFSANLGSGVELMKRKN
ncbi:uncharacterized protein LOC123528612 isoform X1 [Mercenaria mercenaria]|uniref:uncharacterized protein LOC123528612 isoform X1 n=1 Tax=Mercenaria mercenaria TaxID=6596 RepID=UPI001E1DADF3|nr:uncharacterized protein LOC123528612 isoform X1 [Mercenaria mercenaria]XP_045164391.1 uncharacterized protein LOC123528612 isoform X1 [Mercenaria mercenaria]